MATKKQKKQRALEPYQDDEDPRPGILREATPALQKKIEWMEQSLAAEWKRSLIARYNLAVTIKEINDDAAKTRQSRYGIRAVVQIRRYFGWEDGFIYSSLEFAERYTREEIEAIAEMRLPNGRHLTFTHLQRLCNVPDREKRQELLQKVVREGWTAEQLANHLDQHKALPAPGKAPDQRGRPLAIPRTFDALVIQQKSLAQNFVDRATKVWKQQEHCLARKATDLSPEEVTEEKVRAAGELAESLEALAREAVEHAQEARAVYERLKGVFDRQKRGEK